MGRRVGEEEKERRRRRGKEEGGRGSLLTILRGSSRLSGTEPKVPMCKANSLPIVLLLRPCRVSLSLLFVVAG